MAGSNTEFIDNSLEVLQQMNQNASAYQLAAGSKAVELILEQMQDGYGSPIYETGDLQRSIAFSVEGENVRVGSPLEYAVPVHEGNRYGTAPRPYIKDAILSSHGKEELEKLGVKNFSRGF